jgi:hypothetical protein
MVKNGNPGAAPRSNTQARLASRSGSHENCAMAAKRHPIRDPASARRVEYLRSDALPGADRWLLRCVYLSNPASPQRLRKPLLHEFASVGDRVTIHTCR